MKYGFVIEGGEVDSIADLTAEAEAAGWDGAFIADAISIETKSFPAFPWFDPWIALAVMAVRTSQIKIGVLITPVSRRRPWKLAREAVTIDHVSKGRLILGVGLGAANDDGGFYKVGEAMDLKVRARRLDEGLAILDGLWKGRPFTFKGEHFTVDSMTMLPTPLQTPRIPLWVVVVWPKQKSLQRTFAWDGIIPQKYRSMDRVSPEEVTRLKQIADTERRGAAPFEIIVGGKTQKASRRKAAELVRSFEEAGATWWMENATPSTIEAMRRRIKQGPPRI